jgi:hypothetical protein
MIHWLTVASVDSSSNLTPVQVSALRFSVNIRILLCADSVLTPSSPTIIYGTLKLLSIDPQNPKQFHIKKRRNRYLKK